MPKSGKYSLNRLECTMNFSAAIIAGGQSRRFGSDKALYIYNGKPLMQWVIDSLVDSDDRFIVANADYPQFLLPVYGDVLEPNGPLVGIYSALQYAKFEWLAVAACDMPFLTKDYWRLLLSKRENSQVVILKSKHGLQPLAALYHVSIKEIIEKQLSEKKYSVQEMLAIAKLKIIDIKESGIDEKTMSNFNYKKDLKSL